MDFELCDEWFRDLKKNIKIGPGETLCIPNHPKYENILDLNFNVQLKEEEEQSDDIQEEEKELLTEQQFYEQFVQCNEESCKLISTFPQRSDEWINARKYCITASDFGSVIGENPYESPRMFLKKKTMCSFQGNTFTEYGKQNEIHAKDCFLEWFASFDPTATFREVNLIKFHQTPWMAVSPDGLIDTIDNQVDLVEFKCPAKCKDTNVHPYNKYPKNTPPQYYAQIQGIAGYLKSNGIQIRNIWFVVWQPKRMYITLHSFDEEYYNNMFNKLKKFYFDHLLPCFTKKYNGQLRLITKGKRTYLDYENS